MRQTGLLVVAFVITLAVLTGLFFVVQTVGGGSPTATPSPVASVAPDGSEAPSADPTDSPAPTVAPTPTARPTARPTPRPTATPDPTTAPTDAATTQKPRRTAAPTVGPNGQIVVVVPGSHFDATSSIPSNGSVARQSDGSVVATTDRTLSGELELDWTLPDTALPAGAKIQKIDTLVCGTGSGDFWETYGPTRSDPTEYEVMQPAADGCWHYTGGDGSDTTVAAKIRLQSTMTITRIQYTVTLAH
jgi:hypothetical protein